MFLHVQWGWLVIFFRIADHIFPIPLTSMKRLLPSASQHTFRPVSQSPSMAFYQLTSSTLGHIISAAYLINISILSLCHIQFCQIPLITQSM